MLEKKGRGTCSIRKKGVVDRVCAPDVIKFSKVLSSSGIRVTKFIPVYNFPAQQHPSCGNQHILNFKVMAVRDIRRRSLLSKNIHLSRDFWPF